MILEFSAKEKYLEDTIEAIDIFDHVRHNRRCTWIEGDICPLCQEKKNRFNNHHVIWSCDGGRNLYVNILRICTKCHGILTMGEEIEDKALNILASRFMVGYYGLYFELEILRQERSQSPTAFQRAWTWFRAGIIYFGRRRLNQMQSLSSRMSYVRLFAAIKNRDVQDEFDEIEKLANWYCDEAKKTYQIPMI